MEVILKIKELIHELKQYNPDADISTPISEDIGISYICKSNDEIEYGKMDTPQVFIEPTDTCPVCNHQYMNEYEDMRWCDYYDKACKDVDNCTEWENEMPMEYIEDCYEGWIAQSRTDNR